VPSVAWCALCLEIVSEEPRGLQRHEHEMHDAEQFRCITCGASFPCSSDLRRHSRTKVHLISMAFRHGVGSKAGKSSKCTRQRGTPPPVPKESQDAGGHAESFVVPKDAHACPPQGPLKCGVCEHWAASARDLRAHEHEHHTSLNFACATCGSDFGCSADLRRHSRNKVHAISVAFRHATDPIERTLQAIGDADQDVNGVLSLRSSLGQGGGEAPLDAAAFPVVVVDERPPIEATGIEGFVVLRHEPAAPPHGPCRCGVCGHWAAVAKDLKAHEHGSHPRSAFSCLTCGSSFGCSADLRRHSRAKEHSISAAFCFFRDAQRLSLEDDGGVWL